MTTKATMLATCKTRFRDTGCAIYNDAYWNERLAEAYGQVNGASPFWPWLENSAGEIIITAGSNGANLPSLNTRRLIAVFNATDSEPMTEITGAREFRRLYPAGLVSTGTPIHYRLSAGTIQVFPTPTVDTEIDVDYGVIPGTFGSGGDVPEWPADWHSMLIEYAIAHAYLDDGNLDQYQAHMAVFSKQLADMTRVMLEPRGDGYPQIDDNWYT